MAWPGQAEGAQPGGCSSRGAEGPCAPLGGRGGRKQTGFWESQGLVKGLDVEWDQRNGISDGSEVLARVTRRMELQIKGGAFKHKDQELSFGSGEKLG